MLRDSLLEPTETVVEMVAELHRVYSAKIKLTACLAKRVNWRRRCAYSVRAKRTFWRFTARQPVACMTQVHRNILLLTVDSCCFATIAIWRWSICWWQF
ncbi:hypothetical protein ACLK2I_12070 [Escherichia coli]